VKRLALILTALAAVAGAFVASGAGDEDGDYRVRAIFDNAAFVVEGEDVKVAGVRVGKLSDLAVTEDNRAVVVLDIEDPAFQDFRRDASCKIRPVSLIGEEYVDCTPTRTRATGDSLPPELEVIESGPGEGQRLLPVENTSASVDLDLIGEALRRPQRERLSIILGELGVAVAGRGSDLNDVIRRANPALRELDGVLELLARQNDTLARLAADSDRIMAPLARERDRVSGFIENAGEVAEATAERREALEASFERLPVFLSELRPTMVRLGALADEMTPVLADLGASAPQINRLVAQLGPFSRAATPALERLGDVAEPGIPAIRGALPIVRDLRAFAADLEPVGGLLADVLRSFERTDGIQRLMDFIFFQGTAVNGFDTAGHFLRAALLVNVCSTYAITPVGACLAKFDQGAGAASASRMARIAQTQPISQVLKDTAAILGGADPRDVLGHGPAAGAGGGAAPAENVAASAPASPRAEALESAGPDQVPQDAAAPGAPAPAPADALLDYLLGGDS